MKLMKLAFKLFLLAGMLFVSCSKNGDNDDSPTLITGKNKLIVTVVHHTYSIPGIAVFLKNNATEFPGTDPSVYDWSSVSNPSGVAVFENLFDGNYFLYAKGFDSNVGMDVMGATPVVLNSYTLSNHEGHVTIYVTE